jgi:AraC-like DNA-binding protein
MASTLPAVHLLDLVDLAARWRIDAAGLLGDFGLTPAALAAPNARLPLTTVAALVERARVLTGEPALGFYLGLRMRISAHGFLGFAAMTAGTVREALQLATRFAPTRTTALSLRLAEDGGNAVLTIDEHADFGAARDVVIFALLTGIWRLGAELTGRALAGSAEIAFPAPPYIERIVATGLIPGAMRFSSDAHRLIFDAAVLDLALPMADPTAQALAREQCERELAALGFGDRTAPRVLAHLADPQGLPRPLEEVARRLGMSARTLKRHLALENTSFSALRETWLRERATLLLRQSTLHLEAIAERLGYSDAANFTRAFVRWFGVTPGVWRREAASRDV